MADMQSELEYGSQLERTWGDLSSQFDDTTSHTPHGVLFAVGTATAFLTFVAATVTVLNSPRLYWVTAGLSFVGIAILVLVWVLANGHLDRQYTSALRDD